MRNLVPILLLFMSAMAHHISAQSDPLAPFHWEYRIILVQAPPSEVDDLKSDLEGAEAAVNERHIIWFVLGDKLLSTNYGGQLPKDFHTRVAQFYFKKTGGQVRSCLIGKDGGVKARGQGMNLENYFNRIDAMPMRRAEMKAD